MEILIPSRRVSYLTVQENMKRIKSFGRKYFYTPSQAYKRMLLKHCKRQALIPIVNEF